MAWVGHHLLLQDVRVVTLRVVFLNGLFLMTITFLPFPTSLIAEYLNKPSAPVAAAVYAGINALNSLTFWLLQLTVRADEPLGATEAHGLHTLKARLGVLFFIAAASLAFVSPVASLVVIAAVWLWWALPV